jgi:predicted DNA-binding antitoxin AbrB/MazE fold protein
MQRTVQAVFEAGALHPVEPLVLREHQRVTVTVFYDIDLPENHPVLVSPEEWADAARDDIALEEVRRRLSGIRGSFSEAIIAERQDR